MDRNKKKYVLSTIDKLRNEAARQEGLFFEPLPLALPEPVALRCAHCGKMQKADRLMLYPNGAMMAEMNLPGNDISIIANCPVCGSRIPMSRYGVKKSMEAKGSMLRTLLVLAVVLAVTLGAGALVLGRAQGEKLLRQAQASLAAQQYPQAVDALTKAGRLGNADALYLLSECYRSGSGVPADQARAQDLLQQALAKGSGRAQYAAAADCFEQYLSTGSQSSLADCHSLLEKTDDPEAAYLRSQLVRAGIGTAANAEQADQLLEAAARGGNAAALNDCAVRLACNEQADDAEELLRRYGDASDPDILAAQGYVDLFNGKVSDGTSLLSAAAGQGSSWACYYWGLVYYNSLLTGDARDLQTAYNWFDKASQAGNWRGSCEKALCLSVMGDTESSLALAKTCYDRGYLEAGCVIGNMESDATRQLDYMQQAASVQYAPTEIWMGYYYHERDPETSLAYLKRAYDHGARYEANLAANAYFGVGQDYFGPGFVS